MAPVWEYIGISMDFKNLEINLDILEGLLVVQASTMYQINNNYLWLLEF
jgi:hypothetical protein